MVSCHLQQLWSFATVAPFSSNIIYSAAAAAAFAAM